MTKFCPEGKLINTRENITALKSHEGLREAYKNATILEARVVLCDNAHNLHVDLGCMKGIIPRDEGAIGIADGSTRVGMDFKIKCDKCGHEIMAPRHKIEKNIKKTIKPE